MSKKVVINTQFGGFGLSNEAYEWLIAHGVPVQQYYKQPRNPETYLYEENPKNEGQVIYDRTLTPEDEKDEIDRLHEKHGENSILGRYWETWIDDKRDWPLLVQCIEELGERANGRSATLKIVEIPDDVEYTIEEYDGNEHIAEAHKTWS